MEAVPVLLQIQSLVFLQKAKTVEVNGQWQVVQGAEEVVGVEIEKQEERKERKERVKEK